MTPPSITGLLLAAGAGRRFGGGKLVASLPDRPIAVARAAYDALATVFRDVVVVVRPDDAATAALFADTGAQIVVCAEAPLGMGHTLAAGVGARPDAAGWVVALGDMPQVAVSTLARIGDALAAGASIVVPRHAGVRGHPVGFAHLHGDVLRRLTGDAGARELLQREAASITWIDVDDPGVLADVDTREDLARLNRGPS